MARTDAGNSLARLFQIVSLMHMRGAYRLTQADLAAACRCSIRTVGRSLNALEQAGVPFATDHTFGYRLQAGYTPFKAEFTLLETLALLTCREQVTGTGNMPLEHSAASAFEKIASLLPDNLRAHVDQPVIGHVGGAKRNYAQAPWGTILTACTSHSTLEIEYYAISRDETTIRSVDPYQIVWLSGYCHLIAYCHMRHDVRNFSIDGIHRAERTGKSFQIPSDFSLAEHLKGATGPNLGEPVRISVQFSPDVARYARRRVWNFEHTVSTLPDGRLQLDGTVRGLKDIQRELLSWGSHVEVLEPAELRQLFANEARALTAIYAEKN